MIWAAFFNFIAFVVFPLHVAHTIGKGIIDPKIVDDAVLFGALGGAIAWNLITWFYGLPSSSSHALVGGLIGAGFCKGGSAVIQSGVAKTALFIVISPVLGMVLGGGLMVADVVAASAQAARAHRPLVPAAAVRVVGAVQPRPRRQRRAEDDGDHHGDADRQGAARPRTPTCRCG